MRPIHLSLTNFKSHAETDIDLAGMHVAAISGTNGAGKSTILDAIVWALYGPTGLGLARAADTVIREGADAVGVRLTFNLGGTTYTVERTRKLTGKATLELRNGDTSLTKGTAGETQTLIETLIGANAETFLQAVFIGQGDASRFARATAAERKATLVQALSLEQYPPLAQAARDRARVDTAAHSTVAMRLGDLETQAEQVGTVVDIQTRIDGDKRDLATLDAARPALVNAVEQAAKAVEDARVAAASTDAARQRAADLQQTVTTRTADLSRAQALAVQRQNEAHRNREQSDKLPALLEAQPELVDVTELEQAATTAGEKLTEARATVALVNQHLQEVDRAAKASIDAATAHSVASGKADVTGNALDAFRGQDAPECPTCKQDVVGDAHARTLDTLEKAHKAAELVESAACDAMHAADKVVAELREKYCAEYLPDAMQAERDAVGAAAKAQDDLVRARAGNERHHAHAASIATARAAAERQPELDAAVEEANAAEKAAAEALANVTAEHQAAMANLAGDDSATRIGELTLTKAAAELTLKQHDDRRNALDRGIASLTERMRTAQGIASQLVEARAALKPLDESVARWNVLTRAFGRDGIPAQVIRHAKPQIEADINDTLSSVGAPYRVRMDLERDTKAGTVQDTLDITILAAGHERPFDLLSGGEQYRVALALRVAIGRVLANRAGRRIETLVLDEPEGLDAAGFSALADLIKVLGQEFPLVLTVSHTDGLESACDTSIRVEKDDAGASRVTVAA